MERHKSVAVIASRAIVGVPTNCNSPKPYEFVDFFPWACKQYGIDVHVESIIIGGSQSFTKKGKQKSTKPVTAKEKISSSSSLSLMKDHDLIYDDSTIKVVATFDHSNSLIGIKINNNVEVPRLVFQVIDLMIKFYPSLTSLSAGRGIDAYCIYEIKKVLHKSSITQVCLDGTYMKNTNYYILLETVSNLNCLSLARCQINDEITKKLAENLAILRPAEKTLKFLNLSSNGITDTGAAFLADALKTNRHLAYLNLADNRITDTGASHIFDIMLSFPILNKDLEESKIRRRKYLIKKNKLIHKFAAEFKRTEETKSLKRRGNGKFPIGREKIKKTEVWTTDKVPSLQLLTEVKITANLDVKLIDRAENLALEAIGPFEDPFEKTFVKDEIAYCTGNNTLTCLNLAFNNLSYNSLQKLIEVLNYQKHKQQIPRGLFRVILEGNFLPSTCKEYTDINKLLRLALEDASSKQIKGPKKGSIKSKKLSYFQSSMSGDN